MSEQTFSINLAGVGGGATPSGVKGGAAPSSRKRLRIEKASRSPLEHMDKNTLLLVLESLTPGNVYNLAQTSTAGAGMFRLYQNNLKYLCVADFRHPDLWLQQFFPKLRVFHQKPCPDEVLTAVYSSQCLEFVSRHRETIEHWRAQVVYADQALYGVTVLQLRRLKKLEQHDTQSLLLVGNREDWLFSSLQEIANGIVTASSDVYFLPALRSVIVNGLGFHFASALLRSSKLRHLEFQFTRFEFGHRNRQRDLLFSELFDKAVSCWPRLERCTLFIEHKNHLAYFRQFSNVPILDINFRHWRVPTELKELGALQTRHLAIRNVRERDLSNFIGMVLKACISLQELELESIRLCIESTFLTLLGNHSSLKILVLSFTGRTYTNRIMVYYLVQIPIFCPNLTEIRVNNFTQPFRPEILSTGNLKKCLRQGAGPRLPNHYAHVNLSNQGWCMHPEKSGALLYKGGLRPP
jgi:hypothetical protein